MNVEYNQDPKMQGNPPPYMPPTVGPQPVIQGPGVTVIHTNPGMMPVVMVPQMGPNPSAVTCKNCNAQIVSRVERKSTMRTHLFAALLCLLGCWPCVFIPYCTDSCTNADHYCPNCNVYIGTYMN